LDWSPFNQSLGFDSSKPEITSCKKANSPDATAKSQNGSAQIGTESSFRLPQNPPAPCTCVEYETKESKRIVNHNHTIVEEPRGKKKFNEVIKKQKQRQKTEE